MTRFLRTSLAAQFIGFTLIALILSQVLTFLITWNEHSKALDSAAKGEFFNRARSVTRLMSAVPEDLGPQILAASETLDARYWLSGEQGTDEASAWRARAGEEFSRPLENFVDLSQIFDGTPSVPALPDSASVAAANQGDDWSPVMQEAWQLPQFAKYLFFDGQRGYGLAIRLDDGRWLNAAFYSQTGGGWTATSLASLGLTALLLTLIAVFIPRRIARPLRELATSAEALGRGENLPPLTEEGPEEVRRTAEAFNKMQRRLHRFVEDRTRMLAAIGHDLRTPLTTLRLRAEFVRDPDTQHKMLATIDELQGMTEAAIAFARGQAITEDTRSVDLDALVGSICDDLIDLGHDVSHTGGPKLIYRCRPNGLKRAVRNLVENAARYGQEARVSIQRTSTTVDIVVQDCGPGIPDEMKEKVFAPFFRLETSRNRETGGIGLGLSIARAVIRQHGGDIFFTSESRGMSATISLPLEGSAPPNPATGEEKRPFEWLHRRLTHQQGNSGVAIPSQQERDSRRRGQPPALLPVKD